MTELIVYGLALFFTIDLLVNYSTWKDEAKFPSLNYRTIKEYKNKCWRSLIPLIVIIGCLVLKHT